MAANKTASVSVRIDAEVKSQAEEILQRLGISRATAIDMFYRQIIMQNGIPFSLTNEDYMAKVEYEKLKNILGKADEKSRDTLKKTLRIIISEIDKELERRSLNSEE